MTSKLRKTVLLPITAAYAVAANGGIHAACNWLFREDVAQCREQPDLPAHGGHPGQLPQLLVTGTSTSGGDRGPVPRFIGGTSLDDSAYQSPPSVLFRPITSPLGPSLALLATFEAASSDEYVPAA